MICLEIVVRNRARYDPREASAIARTTRTQKGAWHTLYAFDLEERALSRLLLLVEHDVQLGDILTYWYQQSTPVEREEPS